MPWDPLSTSLQWAKESEKQALGQNQNQSTSDAENHDITHSKADFRKCSTFSSPV